MPRVVKIHLAAVAFLTIIQWLMFSANALIGLFGLPVLLIWGFMGDMRHAPERAWLHQAITWTIAAVISYVPMAATLTGNKLWPG